MIQELSSRVAKWMEQENVISREDKELFSYAVYSLLFGLLPIFIVMILGLAFGMLREGLLMITPFVLIRKFSGGYHLNSPKLCIILSTALIALAMESIKIFVQGGYKSLLTVAVFLSALCLCVFSPVDNNSRKLTKTEQQIFRKISCAIALTSLVGYLVMSKAMPIQYTSSFGVGILLAAMLQFLGVVVKATANVLNAD